MAGIIDLKPHHIRSLMSPIDSNFLREEQVKGSAFGAVVRKLKGTIENNAGLVFRIVCGPDYICRSCKLCVLCEDGDLIEKANILRNAGFTDYFNAGPPHAMRLLYSDKSENLRREAESEQRDATELGVEFGRIYTAEELFKA